jgi:hypothetical protein
MQKDSVITLDNFNVTGYVTQNAHLDIIPNTTKKKIVKLCDDIMWRCEEYWEK